MIDIPADIIAAAQESQAKWNVPAAISLAQFGIESSWGTREPPGSNNPFGIKAVAGQPSVTVATHEYVGGRYIATDAAFACFPSVAAAFDAHGQLLATSHYYTAARAAVAGGITNASTDAFANALTGVYATAPTYGADLITLMGDDNLYQFNLAPKLAPVQPVAQPDPVPLTPISTIPPIAAPTPKQPIIQTHGPLIAAAATAAAAAGAGATGATTHVIDFTALINALAPYIITGIVLPLAIWLAGRAMQYLHIQTQSAAGQTVVNAVENGVNALAAEGVSYADAHSSADIHNAYLASVLGYARTAVPQRLAQSGITPEQLAALATNRLAQIGAPK